MYLRSRLLHAAVRVAVVSICVAACTVGKPACRNQPGDPGFPSPAQWGQLSAQVGGRLVRVVPSAKFCHALPAGLCPEDQWQSATFRSTIPGAMDVVSWEQDYLSHPPSLCLQNGTTCGQGNVPLYAINASSAADIEAGVKFAVKHNIKVAVKASGHDLLGRSTAKNSLLLWTRELRTISFTETFIVGGKNQGSAVTVGSGAPLNMIYAAAKAEGKIFLGGVSATVAAAGGYVQGAGHSVFSPLLGLAADNVLEFNIVTANGEAVIANEVENPDLFFALRGGGAGSWGVIISASFRTFPIFSAALHTVNIFTPTASAGALMELHARHIFDWDAARAGQSFTLVVVGPGSALLLLSTYFANATAEQATLAMQPLLDDARAANFTVVGENATVALANDLVFLEDDGKFGTDGVVGSRLIPVDAYRTNAAGIGAAYTTLLEQGILQIPGLLVGGGKVSENANINSAVTPKWRTAKTHIIIAVSWDDTLSPAGVEQAKEKFTSQSVPVLAKATGQRDSGSYSNEADVREPHFQTTFFGPNYARLLNIKKRYDPDDLFIVGAGVGSEEWDVAGLCRV